MKHLSAPLVCLVTDRRRLTPGATADQQVEALGRFLDEAIEAGVDLIQVRERDLEARLLCWLVRRAVDHSKARNLRIVVNDRADVALAAGAHGVHLRADSPPVAQVRRLSSGWTVGRSVHRDSRPEPDADYLLFGTVFGTSSKPEARPSGLVPLRDLALSVRQPVLAIGGITPERAGDCRRAGAAGIAAIGAFLPEGLAPGAMGVTAAVRAFRAALAEAIPQGGAGLEP